MNSNVNIQELLKIGGNVSVTVEVNVLKDFADYLVNAKVKELEEIVLTAKAETYPTPKQVSDILQVDLVTLWRWNKKGYLKHIEFGGGRRYKMSDVKAILNGGK
jgi:hypothetical protein